MFGSFNHAVSSLDSTVSPAEDCADWRITGGPTPNSPTSRLIALPELSRGPGDPGPAILLEFTTVEVPPGAAAAFEARLKAGQQSLKEETLWYRLVTGGQVPRYLRLRPRSRLSSATDGADDQVLAQAVSMITRVRVELLLSEPSLTIDVAGTGRK